jgi:glycosyltransferase involved in cell wall biosynthesis
MSLPPRLLMTTDTVGGVWTYALDLARGLADAGVETALVVLGPPPGEHQRAAAEAIAGLTLIETGLPLDWLAREPAEVLEVGAALRGLARGLRADVIHLNGPAVAAIGGFPAPVIGACHSCLATWWSAVKAGPLPDDFRWRTQLLWQGLHACDLLVAPTRAFAEDTARTYEIPPPRVVWNGRRPQSAHAGPRERIVLAAGRLWDEGKNMQSLDAAAQQVAAPVIMAGPLRGPSGEAVGLRHTRVLGRLSEAEMAGWLARAQVFASPARYEPFGLGVLEAAQAGCALVLSDIASFRELWDGDALFVDPDDPSALAGACNALLADAEASARLGARARRRAARYTAEAMAEGVLSVYRELAPDRFAVRPAEAAA